MKKYLITLSFLLVCFTSFNLIASDDKENSKAMRDVVWAWEMPEFSNYKVPDEYKDESAVILARHERLEANEKKNIKFSWMLFGINFKIQYLYIDRKLVKLNDQKALENFAELSFHSKKKESDTWFSKQLQIVIGARIIKPDGTIHEIDVDKDAVIMTEGKDNKESCKKLTIKGLEKGDLLDYFTIEEAKLENLSIPSQEFVFVSKYPVLHHSVECCLDKGLSVQYHSLNGAPEFEQSKDGDENLLLKASVKNIKSVSPTGWVSPYRSLPIIRLYVTQYIRGYALNKYMTYDEFSNSRQNYLSSYFANNIPLHEFFLLPYRVKSKVKQYKLKNPEATTNDIACVVYDAVVYYTFRHAATLHRSSFYFLLCSCLKSLDIDPKVGLITNRYGARKEELTQANELEMFVSANNDTQYFFYPHLLRAAGLLSFEYEGEPAQVITFNRVIPTQFGKFKGKSSDIQLPVSKYDDNKRVNKTEVRFQDDDPMKLQVKRTILSTGSKKGEAINSFGVYEDWDKQMRERLEIKKPLEKEIKRKERDLFKSFTNQQRKDQKQEAENELKEFHDNNAATLINYSVKSYGLSATNAAFEYETNYTVDQLVKKAGNNLLLDAGKLIGTQYIPDATERKRDFDATLPSAQIIENEISVELPSNYTPEGMDRLNTDFENEMGRFTSHCTVENNQLKIKTSKIYKKNFVSKNDWSSLMQVLDAAGEFSGSVIMLKAKF